MARKLTNEELESQRIFPASLLHIIVIKHMKLKRLLN